MKTVVAHQVAQALTGLPNASRLKEIWIDVIYQTAPRGHQATTITMLGLFIALAATAIGVTAIYQICNRRR